MYSGSPSHFLEKHNIWCFYPSAVYQDATNAFYLSYFTMSEQPAARFSKALVIIRDFKTQNFQLGISRLSDFVNSSEVSIQFAFSNHSATDYWKSQ